MKNILFVLSAAVFVLTGCRNNIDYDMEATVNYLYLNESSSNITVRSYAKDQLGEMAEHIFTIPVGELHATPFIYSQAGGYRGPFNWERVPSDDDYIAVSNGEKILNQRYADKDELYLESNYLFVSDNDGDMTFLYVFRDDFFENGEPIE